MATEEIREESKNKAFTRFAREILEENGYSTDGSYIANIRKIVSKGMIWIFDFEYPAQGVWYSRDERIRKNQDEYYGEEHYNEIVEEEPTEKNKELKIKSDIQKDEKGNSNVDVGQVYAEIMEEMSINYIEKRKDVYKQLLAILNVINRDIEKLRNNPNRVKKIRYKKEQRDLVMLYARRIKGDDVKIGKKVMKKICREARLYGTNFEGEKNIQKKTEMIKKFKEDMKYFKKEKNSFCGLVDWGDLLGEVTEKEEKLYRAILEVLGPFCEEKGENRKNISAARELMWENISIKNRKKLLECAMEVIGESKWPFIEDMDIWLTIKLFAPFAYRKRKDIIKLEDTADVLKNGLDMIKSEIDMIISEMADIFDSICNEKDESETNKLERFKELDKKCRDMELNKQMLEKDLNSIIEKVREQFDKNVKKGLFSCGKLSAMISEHWEDEEKREDSENLTVCEESEE